MTIHYDSTDSKTVGIDLDDTDQNIEAISAQGVISATRTVMKTGFVLFSDAAFTTPVESVSDYATFTWEACDDGSSYTAWNGPTDGSKKFYRFTVHPSAAWVAAAKAGADQATGAYCIDVYVRVTVQNSRGGNHSIGGKLTWDGAATKLGFEWL